jgi:hypothetical protein
MIKFASGRLACVLDSMFSSVALLEHLLLLIYHCYSEDVYFLTVSKFVSGGGKLNRFRFIWHLVMEFNRSMSCSDMCEFLVGRIPQEAIDILRGK